MSQPTIGILEWFEVGEEERVERVLAELRRLGVRHLRTGVSWADWYRENGRAPLVYEDGLQRRDFVSVYDVARACRLALESEATGVANVGSGRSVSVLEIARLLADALDSDVEPVVTGKFRAGDIRHCFAEITRARECVGYEPRVELEEGIAELVDWLADQQADDRVEAAHGELEARGLAR